MECRYSGSYNISHSKKRKLMGTQKIRAVSTMLDKHIDTSVFNRKEAKGLMKEGNLNDITFPPLQYFMLPIKLCINNA